jgi:hypothetical protein
MNKLHTIRTLEQENEWFEYKPFGWSAWRVMRFHVFRQASDVAVNPTAARSFSRVIRSIISLYAIAYLLLIRRTCNILYKSNRSALRIEEGENYLDNFIDVYLRDRSDYIKMEELNTLSFSYQAKKAKIPVSFDPSAVNLLSHVLTLFGHKGGNILDYCKVLALKISKETDIKLDPLLLLKFVKRVEWQRKLFTIILQNLRPKIIVLTDTGDYGLRLASHSLGIPVIEIQHGIFDDQHPDAVPAYIKGTHFELIEPSLLICKGKIDIDQLRQCRLFPARIADCGFEPIDRARAMKSLCRPGGRATNEIKMLVSSQGYCQHELCNWLVELIQHTPSAYKLKIRLKLHPFYDKNIELYSSLKNFENLEIIPSWDTRSIYQLLAEADVHASISSATHYDAAAIAIPTIVIPLAGFDMIARNVDNHSIYLPPSITEAWKLLIEENTYTKARMRSDYYCSPNFLRNFSKIIENTMR